VFYFVLMIVLFLDGVRISLPDTCAP